tara:strand:+ start:232234 stop:232782 length:549 start_codon:yes stop_codon:yes gene_type:complete
MKYTVVLVFLALIYSSISFSQDEDLNLDNALVIAQQDEQSDRYSLEVAILQLLNSYGIKTKASLNVLKQGGSPDVLLTDSLQNKLSSEGIDTYMLISVRGYDKRFRPAENIKSFEEEIKAGHLFPLYRESATSVTFTITFYRNGKPVHYELIKTGTVGSKDAVIKKLMKKMERSLRKDWIKG